MEAVTANDGVTAPVCPLQWSDPIALQPTDAGDGLFDSLALVDSLPQDARASAASR